MITTIQEAITNNFQMFFSACSQPLLKEIQAELKKCNYYYGLVDGLYGPQSARAWAYFKSSHNQDNTAILGAGSLKLLLSALPLTSPYQAGYQNLWDNAKLRPSKVSTCDSVIDNKFFPNKHLYQNVENKLGIPWYVIAVIHSRESDCDFSTHLFNGDPLSDRTVNVPSGQPTQGEPPFTWDFSAICALQYDGLDQIRNWSIASILYETEKYNGLGYFHLDVNSPYVWAGTTQYDCGKYVSDGCYSPDAIDSQLGCAALLIRLRDRGIIEV